MGTSVFEAATAGALADTPYPNYVWGGGGGGGGDEWVSMLESDYTWVGHIYLLQSFSDFANLLLNSRRSPSPLWYLQHTHIYTHTTLVCLHHSTSVVGPSLTSLPLTVTSSTSSPLSSSLSSPPSLTPSPSSLSSAASSPLSIQLVPNPNYGGGGGGGVG